MGDANNELIPIEGAIKCFCASMELDASESMIAVQFNRGNVNSINKGLNCNKIFYGFFTNDTSEPFGVIIEKWADLDCDN